MPLQTYTYKRRTYTVDYRLSQFRYISRNGQIEFIDFASEQGDRIRVKMIIENVHNQALLHL